MQAVGVAVLVLDLYLEDPCSNPPFSHEISWVSHYHPDVSHRVGVRTKIV